MPNFDIPTLRAWIGDGARADGFEEFAALTINAEKSSDPNVRASNRVISTLLIAMVEAGRREDEAGSDPVETLMRMGRGLGFAFMSAMVGKADDAMPLDEARDVALAMIREGVDFFVTHQKQL